MPISSSRSPSPSQSYANSFDRPMKVNSGKRLGPPMYSGSPDSAGTRPSGRTACGPASASRAYSARYPCSSRVSSSGAPSPFQSATLGRTRHVPTNGRPSQVIATGSRHCSPASPRFPGSSQYWPVMQPRIRSGTPGCDHSAAVGPTYPQVSSSGPCTEPEGPATSRNGLPPAVMTVGGANSGAPSVAVSRRWRISPLALPQYRSRRPVDERTGVGTARTPALMTSRSCRSRTGWANATPSLTAT